MTSENSSPKSRTLTDIIKQFLFGLAFGILLVLIPLSYISLSAIELKSLSIAVSAVIILFCGILAAVFGNKFLSPVMKFLESVPPIG